MLLPPNLLDICLAPSRCATLFGVEASYNTRPPIRCSRMCGGFREWSSAIGPCTFGYAIQNPASAKRMPVDFLRTPRPRRKVEVLDNISFKDAPVVGAKRGDASDYRHPPGAFMSAHCYRFGKLRPPCLRGHPQYHCPDHRCGAVVDTEVRQRSHVPQREVREKSTLI